MTTAVPQAPQDFEEYTVEPSTEHLLRWAAAAEDFSPIHFDAQVAKARGFQDPVVHGPWKAAVLRRLLGRWLGPNATVRSMSTRYLRPDPVGRALRFGGSLVSTTSMPDGAYELRCAIWVRDEDDRVSVDGDCIGGVRAGSWRGSAAGPAARGREAG